MRNNFTLLITMSFLILLGLISCTKEQGVAPITEETLKNFETGIIGSWQLVEEGTPKIIIEIDTCGCLTSTLITKPITIEWKSARDDEKRAFKQNGAYSRYLKKQLTCQGTYKITSEETLEVTSNCPNFSEKIVALTTVFLTIKDGNSFYKYRKVD